MSDGLAPIVNDAFRHDRPPDPVDKEKSSIRESQLPILEGILRYTDGFGGLTGISTVVFSEFA